MNNTTALVLAGGINRGYSVLTRNRAKSALPVCGHYRIIDFALSNLSQSAINNVGVIIQYLPGSLIDHIGIGKAYDYDAMNRSFKLMPPFVGIERIEWFRGTADAIYQNLNFISDTNADLVLVLSGDHIYSMDYRPLIEFHVRNNADLTIVTRKRSPDDPPRMFGYPTVGMGNRVSDFIEKPEVPRHDTISMGIYLFDARVLSERLQSLSLDEQHSLPIHVIAPMVKQGRVFSYAFDSDWYYLNALENYVALHQKMLSGKCLLVENLWHVMTNQRDRELGNRPSPYFGPSSQVQESLVSPGCVIEGTVTRSVLSPGVYVAPGAEVHDSILFHDCRVLEGATLVGVVSDKDSVYSPHCVVGGRGFQAGLPQRSDLTIVGKGAHVAQGVHIGPGIEVDISAKVTRDIQADGTDPQKGAPNA